MSLPVETDRGPGVTRDVSVSGLYLTCGRRLAVGDHLGLTLTVLHSDPESLENPESPEGSEKSLPLRLSLAGRVVRVEGEDGNAGAGIALDEGSRYLVQAS